MDFPLGGAIELAIKIAGAALDRLRTGSSKSLSRAVQNEAKKALRNQGLSPDKYALAKKLVKTYQLDELKHLFAEWQNCEKKKVVDASKEMEAQHVRICCCDLFRSMKVYSQGQLPRALKVYSDRLNC